MTAGFPEIAAVLASSRALWAVEECCQAAKNEAGMDHYQATRHNPWADGECLRR